MEVSFNVEAEIEIQFSLLWIVLQGVNINNIPLLVKFVMSVPDDDISVFSINSTMYIKDLTLSVDDLSCALVDEQLVPTFIGVSKLKVAGSSSVLDGNGLGFLGNWNDCLGLFTEYELLQLSASLELFQLKVVSNNFDSSAHWHS